MENGWIKKTMEKSFMLKLDIKDDVSDGLFGRNPQYHGTPIMILQILMISEAGFIVELMDTDDAVLVNE